MKNFIFIAFFILGMISLSFSQRNTDANCLITMPTSGSTFYSDVPFNVAINITNNGPDNIETGDTFLYYFTWNSYTFTSIDTFVLTQDINSGGFYLFQINGLSRHITTVNLNVNFCFVLTLLNNSDGLVDPNSGNNTSCTTINMLINSSIDENTNSAKINLYPNPVGNLLFLKSDYNLSHFNLIRLIDVYGKIVLKQELTKPTTCPLEQLDISALPEGTYICELYGQNQVIRQKIIIQR